MNDWAISGVDLHLDLTAGTGARAGLERALREAVRDGRLAAGTRLPSSRALAKDLGLARNTVADAYGQLVAEGWLAARQGSGTQVAGSAPPPRPARRRAVPEQAGLLLLGNPAADGYPYDLRPGSSDLSAFPRGAWLAAARRAMAAAPNEAFGYSDPRGRPELREALAEYLARVRGVRADPELILVCTGFVQGIGLLARALRDRGARRIGVERLGFPDTRRILRTAGLSTVELPVDSGGARLDGLGPHDRPAADAVLLTPAHQFPAGASLSPERRTAVVEWARATGGTVIEDDYDGEFRYDRQPVGALQGLAPGQVVYAGTASKSLAPGIRLAWLVLPPTLLDAVVAEKRSADRHSPVMDQLTLAELIRSGGYDRHVRRMRLHYRGRRDRLVAALAAHAPRVRVSGIAAGLHAVLELPPGSPAMSDLVARAGRAGLALAGLDAYNGPADGPGALVVGFGTPPEHAFTGALDALCALLAGAAGDGR
ncbi:MocR-like pyridoxine biosynthesis transcription factor PdxR [Streptomyces sp. RKAG337]|uniref:MocR-like pyridoxine biosynthesis transcription factor PdxR n=1 Tax=Streptomyces sp. RKAG337 TaxID=2893404 RepID=UPI002034731E|nr:PLP-dependent aminotransferase family protein [Streptomyces sp. RKAG337]MCM2426633.1 PLP-dependent aminotransferase family protein [Streptomyces sp. RKAG337]